MTAQPDVSANLPELERKVFGAVRGGGRMSVTQVAGELAEQERPLAYTTVMTVLTRLWQKGYLARHQEGRAFLYQARSEDEIAGDHGGRAAQDAIRRFGAPALAGFVKTLSPEQRALVANLLAESGEETDQRE